ncbi:MAG TPA: LuxR C-terminal-related transcriptional regulator, partial [Naasia sp.]
ARLPREATAALAETLTGRPLPAAFLDELQEHSDGIPLHIEELLAAGSPTFLPDTIAEAVRTRSGLLRPNTREVAAAAAVIGRSFALELLEAVSVAGGDVDDALSELVERNLVAPAAGGEFVFRHALICDAVYADIAPRHRRELHAAAAAAAKAAGFHPAFLSAQYERAGLLEEAYRCAIAAAEDAIRVSAHREAAELLRRARRCHPESAPLEDRARLRNVFAAELAAIDENDEAARELSGAIALHRQAGDEVSAARLTPRLMAVRHLLGARLEERAALATDALARLEAARVSNPAVRAELLAALAAAYMLDRRLDEAADYARAAEGLATSPAVLLDLDATIGSVDVFAGRSEAGWSRLDGAIDRATRGGFEAQAARAYRMAGTSASVLVEYGRAEDTIAAGLEYTARTERWNDHHYLAGHLAHVLWATGDWHEAERTARRALADGRGGGTTRITATYVLGYLALGRGRRDEARRHLETAYADGSAMGELQRLSPPLWGLAELTLHEGRFDDCIALTERGLTESERVADAAYLFPFLLSGVRARLAVRDVTAARDWLARCRPLLELRAIPGTLVALVHAEALLELAEGHTGRARELLEAAEAVWRGSRRFWEGTQTLLDLARCADRTRRPAAAEGYRSEVRARAQASGAAALLDGAVSREPAIDPGLSRLSARELEVAMLVAEGATNREIAERLTISPKTAASHIEHILTKLHAARRSEIAAWVARLAVR